MNRRLRRAQAAIDRSGAGRERDAKLSVFQLSDAARARLKSGAANTFYFISRPVTESSVCVSDFVVTARASNGEERELGRKSTLEEARALIAVWCPDAVSFGRQTADPVAIVEAWA